MRHFRILVLAFAMNTFEADRPLDSAAEQSSEEIKREEAMGGKLNPAQESAVLALFVNDMLL